MPVLIVRRSRNYCLGNDRSDAIAENWESICLRRISSRTSKFRQPNSRFGSIIVPSTQWFYFAIWISGQVVVRACSREVLNVPPCSSSTRLQPTGTLALA